MNTKFGFGNGTSDAVMFATEQRRGSGAQMTAPRKGTTIDRRAARTRRALHDALIALILRKGYDAITIQDLIDEADVGRATFYAHYTGKQDLLRSGFAALRAELTAARRDDSARRDARPNEPLAFSRALFEHASEYKDVYRALVGRRGGMIATHEIRRVLSDLVGEELAATREDSPVSRELAEHYIVGAFLTVLAWWLERKPRLEPAQVDAMFRRLVIRGIGRSLG
jgi:AcrR family transcriptional regulator